LRQKAALSEMIWSVPKTLSYLATFFTLDRGDLIFMGTPDGVGPIRPGDRLAAEIEGWVSVEFQVRAGEK
jgi:fumarylpyruvate hydrolase